MLILVIYGLWIMAVSVAMVVRPQWCIEIGLRYCRSRFLHPIEILITLGSGLAFVYFGGQTRFPSMLTGFGVVLTVVGFALVLTPPLYHQRFGIWSLQKFERMARPAGVFSLVFGAFLVYAGL